MGCGVGRATDVAERIKYLKKTGRIPQNASYRTFDQNLNFAQAVNRQTDTLAECGRYCHEFPSDGYVAGFVWSVYRADW